MGWIPAFSFTILYGGLVEIIQIFIPFRSSSIIDFFADIVGASIFLIFYFLINTTNQKNLTNK